MDTILWIPVTERLPRDGRPKLITNGAHLSFASYSDQGMDMWQHRGARWHGQFACITGFVETPTHWAEPAALLALVNS